MALPVLETPIYELTLPSTNKTIKYRPFLVKEYKILLTNIEADVKEISRIVTELVNNCTFNKIDSSTIPHFDLEYLFLNIRAKSISESTDVIVNCECGNKIDHTIDITKLSIVKHDNVDTKILLTPDVGVVLRYPKFEEMLEIYSNADKIKIVDLISECVDAVFTKDEYFDRKSFTHEDINKFINSFTKKQFDLLENFFNKIPKIVHHIEAECDKCGKINVTDLEGLQNFFV